jgi:outer membrane protein assembly factor BamB
MKTHLTVAALLALTATACKDEPGGNDAGQQPLPFISDPLRADAGCDWGQWGQNWAHTGQSCAAAQGFARALASITVDPFVAQEMAESTGFFGRDGLLIHYASPLAVGDDLYMAVKRGTYTSCPVPGEVDPSPPCGLYAWDEPTWTVEHHAWASGSLQLQGSYASTWKPPPFQAVRGWEPVFQPAVHGSVVWVPGAGGTVVRLDRQLGSETVIDPFGTANSQRYVTGPLVVDADGTLLYNVIELDPVLPSSGDARAGYLVRVPTSGTPTKVEYRNIVSGAPAATAQCPYTFVAGSIAGPYPAPVPVPMGPCGTQRPGWNSAPAIGPNGVIFVVSRAHYGPNDTSLVALNPDLSPKWTFRMREILDDGCFVLATSCRSGAPRGVDPSNGLRPTVGVSDQGSSVPVALPDGAVLYGGFTAYNGARGHLVKVSPTGQLMGTYDFGWDVTPAVWRHGDTYSIVTKDNHYFDAQGNEGPYNMTQLSRDLDIEWRYTSTETRSCSTLPDAGLDCVSDHPDGFEWCVNAPAVSPDGTVYANNEDGRVYSIRQGGTQLEQRFLLQSLGAAYTPIAIDSQGRIYSMNGGVMTVVGQ